jgi:uncharacterized phage-associated protein
VRLKKTDTSGETELRFGPDYQKAVQALNFFALHDGGQVNKMKAIKLIFFADRYHLRKYGRPVIGDRYVAMPYGPVASTAKDLAESTVFLADCQREYVDRYLDRTADNYFVMSIAQVDEEVFSDSDVEALEFAWKEFGQFDEYALANITSSTIQSPIALTSQPSGFVTPFPPPIMSSNSPAISLERGQR